MILMNQALPIVPILLGRQDFVISRCRGKNVLHVGCVDSGLTHERFQSGQLMHLELSKVANVLWGIDIDADGIAFLQGLGFRHLVVGDACNLDSIEELRGMVFDVVVASEVLEHLLNPGLFLDSVKKVMVPGHTELIISVLNAFNITTLISLLGNVEYVHPDHNYWFSYTTVTGLLKKMGYEIKEIYCCSFEPTHILPRRLVFGSNKTNNSIQHLEDSRYHFRWLRRVKVYLRSIPRRCLVRALYKRSSFFANCIIVVAVIPKSKALR